MKAAIQNMLLGLLCLMVSSVQAVEKITIQLEFTPDIEDGKTTFGVCARCHLPEAWGNADGTYPQLAGQHVNVLMKQLLDIRNGTRHSSQCTDEAVAGYPQRHPPFIINVSICSAAYDRWLSGIKQCDRLHINPADEPRPFQGPVEERHCRI